MVGAVGVDDRPDSSAPSTFRKLEDGCFPIPDQSSWRVCVFINLEGPPSRYVAAARPAGRRVRPALGRTCRGLQAERPRLASGSRGARSVSAVGGRQEALLVFRASGRRRPRYYQRHHHVRAVAKGR